MSPHVLKPLIRRTALVLALGGGMSLPVSCHRQSESVDLVRATSCLVEASAAGLDRAAVLSRSEKGLRIDDQLRHGLAAGPPARLRFVLDIPRGARLTFAAAVSPNRRGRPPVDFTVRVRGGGSEDLVWQMRLDPASERRHRTWVPVEVDFSTHAGKGRELLLETASTEDSGDSGAAWWGNLALIVPGRTAPLVIIYLVDTLRADHTSLYGYARQTTPELERFARDAVTFERAIAHASWTKPSVASVLTSLLPSQHRAVQRFDILESRHRTLAGILSERGWSTGAIVSNFVIFDERAAFERGFEAFLGIHNLRARLTNAVSAGRVVDISLAWIRSRLGLPTLAYIHTMDPHVPYTPPPPFNAVFGPPPTRERPARDPRRDDREAGDLERLIAQYDGEIAYGDQEFGRFLRELKASGLYEDAFIVFTSDHGEEFLEHGAFYHGKTVYDESIRVPLVVKLPGGRWGGRRVSQQVQGVDILPTVLESVGLPIPTGLAGRPLQRVVEGREPKRPAFAEIGHRGNVAYGVRTETEKYIRVFSPEDGEILLDLEKDPKELANLMNQEAARGRVLSALVEAAMTHGAYRYVMKVVGAGVYELSVSTRGWIEGVETVALGSAEHWSVEDGGRRLDLRLRPRPGQPRRISFSIRPQGAPVVVDGRRDGRTLRPAEVALFDAAIHPDALPYRLSDVEGESDRYSTANLLAPPRSDPPGLQMWFALLPGREMLALDEEARERLRALGYLGPN